VGKKNNMYKERNISKVLPGLKGSPEGDQPLDYEQKLRKSPKMFLTLPKNFSKFGNLIKVEGSFLIIFMNGRFTSI
jgi:hypothetical protein